MTLVAADAVIGCPCDTPAVHGVDDDSSWVDVETLVRVYCCCAMLGSMIPEAHGALLVPPIGRRILARGRVRGGQM
jgi:hypothetical protein